MRKKKNDLLVLGAMRWFKESVSYEGEPYVIDYEQAVAVVDDSLNTIVVARAGSGKTRTIVAKIVYLIVKRAVKPEEIMVFVFNANAAAEINMRLSKMMVDGVPIISGTQADLKIASTFHAFSRRVVYKICKGGKKCGKILAGEKERFLHLIVKDMLTDELLKEKIRYFIRGDEGEVVEKRPLDEEELVAFSKMMALFVNRAQQRFLGGDETLGEHVRRYLANSGDFEREKVFIELGVECFKRYHWYLLNETARNKLCVSYDALEFVEYGTDFNLVVSWASKLILNDGKEIKRLLGDKKYILIDEYQDFSQLFLAAVMAIREVAREAKLFVVGDDLQAINRFAGSDVEYFKDFEEFFPENNRRLQISTNYRCNYVIVDTARKFMRNAMKDKGKFKAFSRKAGTVVLVNPKETSLKYAYMDYDERVSAEDKVYKDAAWRLKRIVPDKKIVRYLKTVAEVIAGCGGDEILILHRNNEMNVGGASLEDFRRCVRWGLDKLGKMPSEDFDKKVRIMTMHKSKGLEADTVIILEADEGVIPKTHPDTRLYEVFGETEEVALDDQKRLFYVAITRAKKKLYILSEGGGFVKYLGKGVEKWGE